MFSRAFPLHHLAELADTTTGSGMFYTVAGRDLVPAGIQIGQLLIEQGVLSSRQVEHILRVQKMSHRPFGDLAERLFGISPQAVEDAWVEQYVRTVGVVDLEQVRIDTDALRLL